MLQIANSATFEETRNIRRRRRREEEAGDCEFAAKKMTITLSKTLIT